MLDPTDPERILILRAISDNDDIQKDLHAKIGPRSIVTFLKFGEEDAEVALRALIEVDATDTKQVMRLQNEVQRYLDMRRWMMSAAQRADEAFRQLEERDRTELQAYLASEGEKVNDA